MKFSSQICRLAAGLLATSAAAAAQAVFAHIIVGNTASYSVATWDADIRLAQKAGIDAFALNIAPPLAGNTATQIGNAFQAATALGTGFKLFFSFDYSGGPDPWASGDVVTVLQQYGPSPSHFRFGPNNSPLVSTFEGVGNANEWLSIRSQVGGIYFVPAWTSVGPTAIGQYSSIIDGLFSWDMWPAGATDISTASDQAWINAIGTSKTYMMGVSPWFYTNLPGYSKAWVWRGDDMWHQRWQQVVQLQPPLVEIVTWNDFGESHYIGPIISVGIPSGTNANAHAYVDNMPHDHWRDLLPYYIAQYKKQPYTISEEMVHMWYRLTPGAAGSTGGVTGNNCPSPINVFGYQQCVDPNAIAQDKVFFSALVAQLPATVTMQIGNNAITSFSATTVGVNHFNRAFNGETGAVTVALVRNGITVASSTGTAILASPPGGQTNYNAWVGGSHVL